MAPKIVASVSFWVFVACNTNHNPPTHQLSHPQNQPAHRCPFRGNRWPWWMIKPPKESPSMFRPKQPKRRTPMNQPWKKTNPQVPQPPNSPNPPPPQPTSHFGLAQAPGTAPNSPPPWRGARPSAPSAAAPCPAPHAAACRSLHSRGSVHSRGWIDDRPQGVPKGGSCKVGGGGGPKTSGSGSWLRIL